MLLVERLTDIVKMESATGWKAIGINEPYFQGHFPDYAVMPGVLIVEAMAQTAGAVVVHSLGFEREKRIVYFMAIDKARFRNSRSGPKGRSSVTRYSGPAVGRRISGHEFFSRSIL